VRWDRESLVDAYDRISDLGDRAELSAVIVLVVGAAIAGVLALVGLSFPLSIGGGLGVAAISMGLLWLHARRRGTTVLGDD
jgi:hypothetical protein